MLETLRRRDPVPTPAIKAAAAPVENAAPHLPATPAETVVIETITGEMPFVEVGGQETITNAPMPPRTSVARRPNPDVKPLLQPPRPSAAELAFHLADSLPLLTAPTAELVVWHDPSGLKAGQYRQVGTGLLPGLRERNVATLLLIPCASDDTAVTIANVGLVLAEREFRRLLLADAWGRGAALTGLFGLAPAPGWNELVHGLPIMQAIQESGYRGLHILGAGNRLVHSRVVQNGPRVRVMLQALREQYDLVVVRSPAAEDAAEALALATVCDAVCIVQRQAADATSDALLRSLQRAGAHVLGRIASGE
jgi:hypothetical protein